MQEATALLVTGDHSLTGVVSEAAGKVPGLGLVVAAGVDESFLRLESGDIAVVLFHLTEGEGLDSVTRWVRGVASKRRSVATLVISDRHQGSQALALFQLGAADYFSRPVDLNRLAYMLDMTTLRARMAGPAPALPPNTAPVPAAPGPGVVRLGTDAEPFLYAANGKLDGVMAQVRRVAPRDTTLLFGGETGTGKTRLARLVHDLSHRSAEPFLVMNCGALSATLIESELFGHVRGAFTGADRDRRGKFSEAGRGTLFLDEVDSLPPTSQARLLRAVEERLFEPVGSNRSEPLRARLIAASNRALDQEVAAGRFRADLYYRLNVVSFVLPPLRERREIIRELARAFASRFAELGGRPAPGMGPGVEEALTSYPWPGNVRELRNAIERAVALCSGPRIELEDLPEALATGSRTSAAPPAPLPAEPVASTLARSVQAAEFEQIIETLGRHSNNRIRTAEELGISRKTLYKKLHKYGLMEAV